MRRARLLLLGSLGLLYACAVLSPEKGADDASAGPKFWWKGNTHTHTLWSDGNGAPELVAQRYREAGYHFLVLSEHDLLQEGESWVPVTADGRLQPEHVDELRALFGDDAVELRAGSEGDGTEEMRLQTHAELRSRFEQPDRFLLIPGEELSAKSDPKPIHVNGINLAERIAPLDAATVPETIQRNMDAITAQGERLGRPVLAHLNHPNFFWAVPWEHVAGIRGQAFFEVYNGHPEVRNGGDASHPSTERTWDLALRRRLARLDLGLIYGIASDDAHAYHATGPKESNMQRGWIQVRARHLDAESLIAAMQAGDFYASTGVELLDVGFDGQELIVDVASLPGETYTTRFLGAREGGEAGELLLETTDDPATYTCTGDELYVRAIVTSSEEEPNSTTAGALKRAWVQPVVPARP